MNEFISTKPIFDTEKLKKGYFIEVNEDRGEVGRHLAGIITFVGETTIDIITAGNRTEKVFLEDVEKGKVKIKVAKELNPNSAFDGLFKSFIAYYLDDKRHLNLATADDIKPEDAKYDVVTIDDQEFVPNAGVAKLIKSVEIRHNQNECHIIMDAQFARAFDSVYINGAKYPNEISSEISDLFVPKNKF